MVQITPTLIRKGPILYLSLVTDGPPSPTHNDPLADVSVRKQGTGRGLLAGSLFAISGMTISFATMIVAIVRQASNTGAIVALLIVIFGVAIAVAGLGIMAIESWTLNRALRTHRQDKAESVRQVPN